MKYAIFFIGLIILLIKSLLSLESAMGWVLIWPILNCFMLSLAYVANRPGWVLGKTSDGRINVGLLILNMPWLALSWLVFKLQLMLSSEDSCNRISGTNIWISSRPQSHQALEQFDLIVDLTAEFLKDHSAVEYLCLANLDGHDLTTCEMLPQAYKDKNVLVHCANGHGRSSCYVALLMMHWGYADSVSPALDRIKQSRPLAYPDKAQRRWLERFSNDQ